MRRGARVALVTDAGTPAISDPGFRVVRETLEAGIRVGSIPGPSAVVAALSIAGLPTDRFTFEGFLSSKPASRRNELKALARERRTMVFFEAARRLGPALTDMAEVFGAAREAAVAREIGKTYEEVVRANLGRVGGAFHRSPGARRDNAGGCGTRPRGGCAATGRWRRGRCNAGAYGRDAVRGRPFAQAGERGGSAAGRAQPA